MDRLQTEIVPSQILNVILDMLSGDALVLYRTLFVKIVELVPVKIYKLYEGPA